MFLLGTTVFSFHIYLYTVIVNGLPQYIKYVNKSAHDQGWLDWR